jgi:hypothetical protein
MPARFREGVASAGFVLFLPHPARIPLTRHPGRERRRAWGCVRGSGVGMGTSRSGPKRVWVFPGPEGAWIGPFEEIGPTYVYVRTLSGSPCTPRGRSVRRRSPFCFSFRIRRILTMSGYASAFPNRFREGEVPAEAETRPDAAPRERCPPHARFWELLKRAVDFSLQGLN